MEPASYSELGRPRRENFFNKGQKIFGLVRDLNPGPLAPEARIIPLDQRAVKSDGKDRNKIFLEGFLGQHTVGKVFLDVHRTNALSRVGRNMRVFLRI